MNLIRLLNPAHDSKVEIALYQLAQRNSTTGVVAPIVVPLIIFIGFGKTIDTRSLTIWLSIIVCTVLTGLITYRVLNPKEKQTLPTESRLRAWRRANLLSLVLAGIAWGSLSIMFDAAHAAQNAALLLTYLAVVTAGANTSAVHSYRAYFIVVAISLAIMLLNLPRGFGEQSTTIGVLLFVYSFFVANVARNAQSTILRSIHLQDLNEQLMQEKAVAAQLAERERIYRDLHDDVGAKLLGLAISAQRSNQTQNADLARSALQDLRDVVSRSAHSASRLDNLLANMRAETAQRVQAAGIALDWRIPTTEQALPVSAAAALNLNRLLREAVSNVLRHARANRISVDLAWHAEKLTLTIQDDGIGLPASGAQANRGMNSMRTRASALGGSIVWEASPLGGCSVVIEISLPHIAQEVSGATAAT